MAADKKLENLQEEIKLLKGEVKSSLASVRDYLLNMELPSSEFSTILAALNADGGTQKVTIDGNLANTMTTKPRKRGDEETEEELQDEVEETEDELEHPAEDEDLLNVDETPEEETEELADEELAGEDLVNEEENLSPEDTLPAEDEAGEDEELETTDEQDEALTPESELPAEEEQPMEYGRTATDVSQLTPKVNMLANLITWVARIKKEIGSEQIPTFLEVYGISGHLSSELKDVIIHLAEITRDRPDVANNAEVWSQAMLALHGIITGGDAPLHPVIPSWTNNNTEEIEPVEEEIIEIDKAKEKPVKLKLVFPDGNGKTKEFCINLAPEEDRKNSKSTPDAE